MAYFGGENGEKVWQLIDIKFVIMVLLVTVAVFTTLLYVLRSGMLEPARAQAGTVIQPATPRFSFRNDTAEILVARVHIAPMQKLERNLFNIEERSIEDMENTVVTSYEPYDGWYAAEGIRAGSPLHNDIITPYSPAANTVTASIPPGYRAVTIPVDALSGVEGWVTPGTSVDIVWSTRQRDKLIVTTIVENVKVLSAERTTMENQDTELGVRLIPKYVTLLASAREAQKIQLAKNSGSLSLNLRGDGDQKPHGSETITLSDLLNPLDVFGQDNVEGHVRIGSREFGLIDGKLQQMDPETGETMKVATSKKTIRKNAASFE